MKKRLYFLIGAVFIMNLAYSQDDKIQISQNLELIKLTENVYRHVSYKFLPEYGRVPANGLIYISGHKALLLDSPWTNQATEDLYNWLLDSMQIVITGFIPNHWHSDCMGGLEFLQSKSVKSYANRLTIEIAGEKNLPVPDQGFEDSLIVKIGSKFVVCHFLGAAHSLDNIVVWLPLEKILFPACIVKSIYAKNLGNTSDGDIGAYPFTLDRIIQKFSDAEIVVPGHGSPGGPELLEHTKVLTAIVK